MKDAVYFYAFVIGLAGVCYLIVRGRKDSKEDREPEDLSTAPKCYGFYPHTPAGISHRGCRECIYIAQCKRASGDL